MNQRTRVALLAVAVFGISQTAFAYRTAEDSKEFAGAGNVAWRVSEIPFVMNEDIPSGVSGGALQNEIEIALTAWSNAGCNEPRMLFRGYVVSEAVPGDGTNTIQWVMTNWSDYGFSKSAAAMTDVQYQENTSGGWDIVETDIYVNADNFDWSGLTDKSQNIGAVILHEAGHVLGLLHPCETNGGDGAPYCSTKDSFAEAIMYPVYQSVSRQLGADDIGGVCYLYPGESGCAKNGCDKGEICTAAGCQESCGGQVCLTGYTCEEDVCVRVDSSTSNGGAGSTGVCGSGGACINNSFVYGNGKQWDPCTSDKDCMIGFGCFNDFCTTRCSDTSDCVSNATCSKKGICEPAGAIFGENCDVANDCASSVCVVQDNHINRCTRECSASNDACPNGWFCTNPDNEGFICMPERADGCSCRLDGRRGPFSYSCVALLGLLGVSRHWRRFLGWRE